MAHDLRNLLTVILGYTDLVIQDLGPDHPSTADLEVVQRSAEQARALVGRAGVAEPEGQGSKR